MCHVVRIGARMPVFIDLGRPMQTKSSPCCAHQCASDVRAGFRVARKIDRLSARGVATLGEGLHADGGGLYLKVESTGARRWTFIFRFRGARREMGLGSANDISLAAAREEAQQARALARAGTSPIEDIRRRRAAQSLETFGAMADQLIADLSPQCRKKRCP